MGQMAAGRHCCPYLDGDIWCSAGWSVEIMGYDLAEFAHTAF